MRQAYQTWNSDEEKINREKVMDVAKTYDHKPIGYKMKELLNDS